MSRPDAPGPVRTCVGCRRRRPIDALVRLTRSAGSITVGGPSDGRGAWLCIDGQCVDTAIAKRAFARAWRTGIDRDDEQQIREHIAAFGHDEPAVEDDSGATH